MGDMKDKVCVVTGGGGSLGRESAGRFLEEGARGLLTILFRTRWKSD